MGKTGTLYCNTSWWLKKTQGTGVDPCLREQQPAMPGATAKEATIDMDDEFEDFDNEGRLLGRSCSPASCFIASGCSGIGAAYWMVAH